MRQTLARTLTLFVLVATAACGAQPTATATPSVTPAATLTAAPAEATATEAPTAQPTEAAPIPTLPPPATSAPTEAPRLTPPDEPCTDPAVSLAPELMLGYTAQRSDGLGASVYVVRADGTQPAEFVQGARAASWSPNGQRLAFLTETGDPARPYALHLIWDDGSHEVTAALNTPVDLAAGLRWSPDGRYLLLNGGAGVFVVDAQSGQVTNVASDLPNAAGGVWAPDSTRLAFQAPLNVALNNEYRIYTALPDGSDRVQVASETLNDFVQAWQADGTRLLVRSGADAAGPQQIYSVALDGTRERLFGGQSYADNISWSPNGKQMAYLTYQVALDTNGNITGQTQWLTIAEANGANPHTLQQLVLGYGEPGLSAPQWSPNGRYVAFLRGVIDGRPDLLVADVCTDAQTQVASAVFENFSWRAGAPLPAVNPIVAVPPVTEPTPAPNADAAAQLAWTPDGLTLAAATTAGVRFYDAATGGETTLLPASGTCCTLTAFDGQYLASITPGGTGVTVYDWQTQQVIFSIADQAAEQFQTVALSPDGTRLATGERFEVRLFELPSGEPLTTFQTAEVADSYVVGLAFTPDGGALVSVTQWEGIVQVWDVDALTVRRTFRIPTVTYFTLTPGGRQLAADYAKPGFELWEPATGARLGNHPDIIGAGGPQYTAFSTDSRRVAVWGYVSELGRTLAVWDVANNRQLTAMALDNSAGTTNDWLSATFSPDGTRLAASDAAGHIYLYETDTWTEVTHWAVPNSAAQP